MFFLPLLGLFSLGICLSFFSFGLLAGIWVSFGMFLPLAFTIPYPLLLLFISIIRQLKFIAILVLIGVGIDILSGSNMVWRKWIKLDGPYKR